jgi:hypothetical protein
VRTDAEIIDAVERAFSDCAKPEHFTNHLHCEECEEHDQTLLLHDRESLRVGHVNNPGWDPLCYCSPAGKAYYMPALVRFALANVTEDSFPYWQQLLFHLEGDGPDNAFVEHCSKAQRHAVAAFLEHLIESRAAVIEQFGTTDEILKTHGYWAHAA